MSEPVTTSTATAYVFTAGLLTLLPGVDPGVVIGAFTGSLLFIISDDSSGHWRKAGLFIISFLGGLLCAQWAANLLSLALPSTIAVNPAMASIIAAASVVRLLQKLTSEPDTLLDFIRSFRGKK
ncbi:putative holin [Shewanella dokdonensis]|uniref:putative holin n=1 Tax=Shewanella dokdonensis TaxID=712036 RepID=UPI00200DDECD|nr:putative holin [Shewanella dokdonensis]MCL1075995.1 phage holin family protein [Shewanella dokdonensis]